MALVIQLVDRMCNDCFKLKHLFLLSLDLVDILVKNVDELGSEHHVRTHINEPPCLVQDPFEYFNQKMLPNITKSSKIGVENYVNFCFSLVRNLPKVNFGSRVLYL